MKPFQLDCGSRRHLLRDPYSIIPGFPRRQHRLPGRHKPGWSVLADILYTRLLFFLTLEC